MYATPAERRLSAFLLSLIVGIAGLSFFHSDLGPGESPAGRLASAVVIAVAFGGWAGFFLPRGWILPAALSCWGAVLAGLSGVAMGDAAAVWPAVLPLAFAVAAGYVGSRLGSLRGARLHR